MHPLVRGDSARGRELDHSHWWSASPPFARPALQRGFQLPNRRIPWPADSVLQEYEAAAKAIALGLELVEQVRLCEAMGRRREALYVVSCRTLALI